MEKRLNSTLYESFMDEFSNEFTKYSCQNNTFSLVTQIFNTGSPPQRQQVKNLILTHFEALFQSE